MEEECSISWFDAVLMVCVAFLYDLTQFGVDVVTLGFGFLFNWVISLWAWLSFYLWFRIKGVNFMSWKNALKLNGGGLVEIAPLPLIGSLPVWTATVLFIILTNAPWSERVIKAVGKVTKI